MNDRSMSGVTYCEQWSRHYKERHTLLTEQEAQERHREGKLYTAVLGDAQSPWCFLEFSAFRSVAVEFLDSSLRTYLGYSFQEMAANRFFVSKIRQLKFLNDADVMDRGNLYLCDMSGRVVIEHYVANSDGVGSRIVDREERVVDVSGFWEPFPEFGKYEGLSRIDRGIPILKEFQP